MINRPPRKKNPDFDKRYIQRTITINKEKDPEIIRKLAMEKSANEYILNLIREDLKKGE